MEKTMYTQFLRNSWFLLVILLLGVALSLTMAHGTEAATLYVSIITKGDTGDCQLEACKTIQYAIDKASNGDTIELSQGTFTEAGITIYKDLTIQGDSAANTIVQAATTTGTASDRVFRIKPGLTAVSIKKMTIRHGKSLYGGGVFIATKATVVIGDSVITKNSTSYNGRGGGIYVATYGTLTLNNSTLSHNTTTGTQWTGGDGGGIFGEYHARVMLKNSTISSNSAEWDGGGIRTSAPVTPYALLIIANSTISQNQAYYGGGILSKQTYVVIVDSAIFLNDADSRGGGIFSDGTMSLINSTIADNDAYIGAGILNEGDLTITDSTISRNNTPFFKNGIKNMATVGNSLAITNSTISENNIANSGTMTISNSTLFNAPVSNLNIANIKSTIIANNVSGNSNCYGASLNVSGNNLSTDSSCKGFTQVTLAQLKLGGLSLNLPGDTSTHYLQPQSVAIDAASDCNDFNGNPVTTDQRGVSRPYPAGGKCDIGAYEADGGKKANIWPMPPGGGTIHLPDGTASFFFPPEAVSDDVLVVIERSDDDLVDPPPFVVLPPPEGWQRIGAAYDLRVYDVEENPINAFHRPVELLLRYNPEEVDSIIAQSLVIHFYDPEAGWAPFPSEVDPEEHTVMTSTEHPGLFGLFGLLEPPESFDSLLNERGALDELSSLDVEEHPSTKFEESSELMPSSIPEPATISIFGIGLALLIVIKRIVNKRK